MEAVQNTVADGPRRLIRVAFVTASLGLGGTEKGLVSFATRLDRARFAPTVITTAGTGPRQATLEAAGVPVVVGAGTLERLSAELDGVDVVHVVRHGIAEPLVPSACARAGVPVLVETNIFGAHDRSGDEAGIDCHLFLSEMCLMRYTDHYGGATDFDARHRVLYLPVESAALRAVAPSRAEARRELGLAPDRPVVGRLGRAADLKWRDLLIDMIPHLLTRIPEAQILLVGATEAKRARLERLGIIDRVHLVEPVAGDRELATLYAACDVVVSAAVIGESQGLAIAEAMTLGIPVVTCSTPWADNAQIEFVRNGETGWVANHPRAFAEAVADLLSDEQRRLSFGETGRELIARVLDPDALTRQLERLYVHHLRGESVSWRPSAEDVARFTAHYPSMARACFRKLSGRERAEAALTRLDETFTRRLASVRMVAAGLLARARSYAGRQS